MNFQLDRSFEADYDVESRLDLPSVIDYDFHQPNRAPWKSGFAGSRRGCEGLD
jgi:hypothetical protein